MLRYLFALSLLAMSVGACSKSQSVSGEPEMRVTAEESASEQAADDWTAERAHSDATDLEPAELAAGIAAGTHVAVDVNGEGTRMELGVVPDALLMNGPADLDALDGSASRIPVFYCGSPSCMAAPAAAANAMNAGVEPVAIMSAGIRGWISSGQDVEAYAGSASDASMETISVADAAAAIEAGEARAVDANNAETRDEWGTLPGAILLSSYGDFAETELPGSVDEPLVFYCFNRSCSAAPQAAMRAMEMGYTNVSVMEAGIQGWNDAMTAE